jgi:HTH-type transcriptional regulator/antitoxin HigA
MDVRVIKSRLQYQRYLKEAHRLLQLDPDPRTPEGARLELLVLVVETYEKKRFPMDLPDPVEAIKFRMEQSGLGARDLVPMIGRLNRVYEVLGRKRTLTLPMIRALHEKLNIPSESLIREPAAGIRVNRKSPKARR